VPGLRHRGRGTSARGRAGAGLLAHIVVSKYDDHLPLYRQAEIFPATG
jgi:transposase